MIIARIACSTGTCMQWSLSVSQLSPEAEPHNTLFNWLHPAFVHVAYSKAYNCRILHSLLTFLWAEKSTSPCFLQSHTLERETVTTSKWELGVPCHETYIATTETILPSEEFSSQCQWLNSLLHTLDDPHTLRCLEKWLAMQGPWHSNKHHCLSGRVKHGSKPILLLSLPEERCHMGCNSIYIAYIYHDRSLNCMRAWG